VRRASREQSPPAFDPRHYVFGPALVGGTANVIMQLAQRPVGRAVIESTVESGQLTRHPLKRTRTTLTYLAVALLGTEDERRAFRRAVDRAHAQVVSTPDSPVAYRAFDPHLQLWVAACLYRGLLDVLDAMHVHPEIARDEEFYRYAARLATTLQVPADMWPADIDAYWRYWHDSTAAIAIDAETREYLTGLAHLTFAPRVVSRGLGGLHSLATRGLLPPEFRTAMGFAWTERDQRRFDAVFTGVGDLTRVMPGVLRRFPFNACLWDLRRRIRRGRPLV
jgi:uncharacterized protein (DUF2236 family)